jgi:hypothetical protein
VEALGKPPSQKENVIGAEMEKEERHHDLPYTHLEDLTSCASVWRTTVCEDYDLWCCGLCGEIREYDWGLKPVVDPDGCRHIVCPDCRAEYPELVLAQDGEMSCDYPDVNEGDLPFHLDGWLHDHGFVSS